MTVLQVKFDLQMFAEGGGDGGAPAAGSGSGTAEVAAGAAEKSYPKNIPDRAKKYYDAARKKTQNVDTATMDTATSAEASPPTEEEKGATATPTVQKKLTYKELIESEDYKADHERHMQKALRDRMKGTDALLSMVAEKFGLDMKSETFKADLEDALRADSGAYERYAEEHDIPVEEAKKIVDLTERLDRANKQAQERREAEQNAEIIGRLRTKAQETQKVYPDFDLDSAMQNERFRRLTAAFGGDTTQAYEALNHKALQSRAVAEAEARAQAAVANSVKANRARPAEGGISSTSNNTHTPPDFKSMGLEALRQWGRQNMKR